MRKSIFIIMLLAFEVSAQELAVSIYVDVQNGIKGSEPTQDKPALDVQLKGLYQFDSGMEVGLQVESFNKIGYYNFMFQTGYALGLTEKIDLVPSIGLGQIIRSGTREGYYHGFFTYELNGEIRYVIYAEKLSIQLKSNYQRRPDVPEIDFRFSGFVGLMYKI